MLPQDILGAATGVGLALFIALSAIICKYYSRTRKERMILYSPPRRPSQDRRQKRLMRMREAKAMASLPPQQQLKEMTRDDKPLCSSQYNKHLLLQEYFPRLFDGTLKRITSTPKKCHRIKFEYSNGIMSQYKFLFSEQMGLGQ
ncbi:uncharacterized protein CDAR_563531 [Caerostris darwini]|uniref:Uncharacterized protein n=1 Tax=Caerostris darwini TaxID=1538125 RepID=A0AAV4RBR0_9ARAC|nr:uncharacterized protein CDAR_563531 [Caerostris darwini]